jgi:hypothetical protein
MDTAAKVGYQEALNKANSLSKIGGIANLGFSPSDFSAIQNFQEMFPDLVEQVQTEQRVRQNRKTPPAQRTQSNPAAPPVNPASPEAKRQANPFGAGAAQRPAQPAPAPATGQRPLQGVF